MRTLLTMFAILGLVGCVGGIQEGPGDDDGDDDGSDDPPIGSKEGKVMYDRDVHSIVAAKCIGCHNAAGPTGNITGFVNSDPAQGYDTTVAFVSVVGDFVPNNAAILQFVVRDMHKGITYTTDEVTKMTAWLNKEVEERVGGGSGSGSNPGGETPAAASERLLREWSGCMSQDNFNTSNMAQAWGNLNATNNQQCENCHANGGNNFVASRDTDNFFRLLTSTPISKYLLLQYFSVDLSQGVAAAKMTINQQSFINVSQGKDPHREHPRFDALDNNGMQALQQFYTLTMDRKTAAQCDPPRLPQ